MPNVFSRPSGSEWEDPDPAYDERKPIDKNLPPRRTVNLGEWLAIWTRLSQSGNNHDRDTFALTGHYTDPDSGERLRAEIDLSGCCPKATDVIYQLSDIDSVIGIIYESFPFKPAAILKFYMTLSVSHTLRTSLHIPPITVKHVDGTTEEKHLHQIPNTRLLEMQPNGLVRIFFPFCELPGGGVCMDEAHMRDFYNLALYPAAVATLPEDLIRDWPSDMGDEWFRGTYRNKRDNTEGGGSGGNKVQQTGRDIPAHLLNTWMDEVRKRVGEKDELKWARNFFFAIEMRGTKNQAGSVHPPPENAFATPEGDIDYSNPRAQAVEQVLQNFDTAQFQPGCWYLDLATRITVSDTKDNPSACTFAISDMHAHLLAHFTGLDWDDCVKHVEGGHGRYSKDEVAHLNNISGARFFGRVSDETGVCYIQIYTTDKSVTYNVSLPNHAQRTNARVMVKSFESEVQHFVDPLINAFRNSSQSHGVALRIESRVDFFAYPYVHLHIPDHLVRRCIYRLDRHIFWGWKLARLVSMRAVMLEWATARPRFTLDQLPESGTMLLILVWMINALVNRPDDGKNWDQVRDTACVHRMHAGQLVAARPLGAVFIPKIRFKINKQPRVSSQRALPIDTICYLMSTQENRVSEGDIYQLITGTKPKRTREDGDPTLGNVAPAFPHRPNKQRRVKIMSSEKPENQFAHVMPQSEREQYSSEEEDPEERESTKDFGAILTNLVHSYPIQIIAKAPNNTKSSGSWCSLTREQRAAVKFDLFSSRENLRAAFRTRVEFPADGEKWQKMVRMLFPDADDTKEYQGVSNLGVRQDYQKLLRSIPTDKRDELIQNVRDYVSKHWVWLPFGAPKGHLWATGKPPDYTESLREVVDGPHGPWIIFNPAFDDE
ncbi:hypothetical protein RSAG8_09748, partial [Rhizoctonia solani AG-8 WAC10335]